MTVKIDSSEYELEYGIYSSKEPYNFVIGNIGAYIDYIDKRIVIHAWDLDAYTNQMDIVEEVIWFELFCAYAYERFKVDLWRDSDVDANAYSIIRTMSEYMPNLLDAYYDIKTDLYHYIFENSKEEK